jgi:hypothetical protein
MFILTLYICVVECVYYLLLRLCFPDFPEAHCRDVLPFTHYIVIVSYYIVIVSLQQV